MDPALINAAAQQANQVGLLTWVVVAMMIFCGAVIILVLVQNNKREERYAKLVEVHIEALGTKIDGCAGIIKDNMNVLTESARFQKQEHADMITSLRKTTETLIALAAVMKLPGNAQFISDK